MRHTHGRKEFHSRRHDRDDGAGRRPRREAQIDWLKAQEAQEIEREVRAEAAAQERFRRAQIGIEEAAAGHKSVDGLYPRDAEEKA